MAIGAATSQGFPDSRRQPSRHHCQTHNAVLAAHLLLQSVEAKLPKQKKNLDVTKYKNAMVSHKGRSEAH
ncbi:hypothetical protein C1H46_000523 [Malus baccata]|uniref:F-box protein At5g52880-like ARM repeats region domain-containing protein n=1 Tax=Malus baccata TaxID=106549 RepID=A0A540NS76_MALBA|nr:hypothetical protein C1H46_000523 [Malus baccata]